MDGLKGGRLTRWTLTMFRGSCIRMLFVVMVIHGELFEMEEGKILDLTKALLERYKIQNTVISGYHPQANGLA